MRTAKMTLVSTVLAAIFGSAAFLIALPGYAQSNSTLLGSTNRGELVEIDLASGTVSLIGTALAPGGWTDLALDESGDLYAVSRSRVEVSSVCFGVFATGPCSHLYRLDPVSGAVVAHVGDLEAAFVSDIEFSLDGMLFANRFVDLRGGSDGGLLIVDPMTAATVIPPNIRFGAAGSAFDLENGGLAHHPVTGELWAVESGSSGTFGIFRVDPATGQALAPVVRLGIGGGPTDFGFDSLGILADGRFIATIGGVAASSTGEIYEIAPNPSPTSGLAEVSLIPLAFDSAIVGKVNGLAAPTVLSLVGLIQALTEQIVVLNIRIGISNSLDAKLDSALMALDDLNDNNDQAAVNSLYAFVNSVEAQRGVFLTDDEADVLVQSAEAIITAIESTL